MTPPAIPKNAYTDAPEQHPNLILGSLQLLFWLVFRPTAWEKHIYKLGLPHDEGNDYHPIYSRWRASEKNFLKQQLSKRELQEKSKKIWRFRIQVLLFLPLFAGLINGFFLSLNIQLEEAVIRVIHNMALSIPLGLAVSLIVNITYGTALSLAFSIVGGITNSITNGAIIGIACGLTLGIALGRQYGRIFCGLLGLVCGVIFSWAGYVNFGLAFGFGLCVNWWRPVIVMMLLVPWHYLLYQIDQGGIKQLQSHNLFHRHVAFWDEWQYLPIWGLDQHLLWVWERNPSEGWLASKYLTISQQRWAVVAAQIELDARQLESCIDAMAIGQIHQSLAVGELASPAESLFRSFNHFSEDVAAALHQASAYNQRLALAAVGERLNGLVRELTRSSDPYAVRFRPVAQRWGRIIEFELETLTKTTELRQEIDSPYIIGVPLTERQEIFVGRTDLSQRLEQLLLDKRRPPLLLYGQRRMGKTSLLSNLGRLLPNRIVPLYVDLQGPASRASDHAGFLYNLARGMTDSAQRQRHLALPPLPREALADDPFTRFDEWLDAVEVVLADNTALLALDEFEALDQALSEGRFSETAVLGMLRHLIQHRPRFKVLLAGSHTLQEFQRWASYLINAQVLHLGYLKESEARQLIEQPSPDFALRYQPEASQRVLAVTRGHPFLVQLLCAEIVVLKNEQDPSIRRLATLADVEAAIPEALASGSMFFGDIEGNQLDAPALAVMRYLTHQGEGATVSAAELGAVCSEGGEEAIDLLCRRELIEPTDGGYRIQVELIRRWFVRH